MEYCAAARLYISFGESRSEKGGELIAELIHFRASFDEWTLCSRDGASSLLEGWALGASKKKRVNARVKEKFGVLQEAAGGLEWFD